MSPLHDAGALLRRHPNFVRWREAPPPLAPACYTEALHELLDRAQRVEAITAVYDLGPVRFPGLSDLDVLFVLRDDFSQFDALRPLLRALLPEEHHGALTHDPFFVRERDLRSIFQFAPILQLRPIDLERAAAREDATLRNDQPLWLALYLADIIAESYPREFIALLLDEPIDERAALARVKGLTYCYELLERIGGTGSNSAAAFAREVQALREGFFTLDEAPRRVRLLALIQQAAQLSLELAEKTAALLARDWCVSVGGRLRLWASGAGALYEDAHPAQRRQGEPRFTAVRLRRLEVAAQAPALFGWLVRQYARGKGPVSRRLRARLRDELETRGEAEAGVMQAIAQRIALRNEHAAWADRAGLGLATFLTFGYRTRDGKAPGRNLARRSVGAIVERLREGKLRRALR